MSLLNISNLFAKHNKIDEQIETDILFGYSLVASRKFLQASELFIKTSLHFLQKVEGFRVSDFTCNFPNQADNMAGNSRSPNLLNNLKDTTSTGVNLSKANQSQWN